MTSYGGRYGTLGFGRKQVVADTSEFRRANDTQVGGSHYKKGGEEHWDRAWRLKYDPFQYIITKWVERWRDKGGLEDLYKARHAINKYIEVIEGEQKLKDILARKNAASDPVRGDEYANTGAGRGYVDQD